MRFGRERRTVRRAGNRPLGPLTSELLSYGGGSNGKSRHLNCDCIAVAHDLAQGVAILLKNEDSKG
jgi:hypothetical protein